jgi:hypothetical protein
MCAEGSAAVTRHKKQFEAEIQQIGPHANILRCITLTEALAARDLDSKLHPLLQEAVKIVIFLKVRPLNSHLIALLC